MKNTITLLLLGFGATVVQAQTTTNATGGNTLGSGGSVSYSVGQMGYTTYTGTGGTASAGVQQAYVISTLLDSPEFKDISLQIQAYPNPTVDFLTLDIGGTELSGLHFQLFDISGKLIESRKIASNIETIPMANLPMATYLLKITHNNQEVKTFKILKRI